MTVLLPYGFRTVSHAAEAQRWVAGSGWLQPGARGWTRAADGPAAAPLTGVTHHTLLLFEQDFKVLKAPNQRSPLTPHSTPAQPLAPLPMQRQHSKRQIGIAVQDLRIHLTEGKKRSLVKNKKQS